MTTAQFLGTIAGVTLAGGLVGYFLGRREEPKTVSVTSTETYTETRTLRETITKTQITTLLSPVTSTVTNTIEKTVVHTVSHKLIQARFPFSGANLVWWPTNYEPISSQAIIDHLASLPANYLMLLLELEQRSKNSSELRTVYNIQNIRIPTEYAKGKGMKTAWLPFIIVRDGTWRGEIEPDDPDRWFTSYSSHLTSIALLADQMDVDLLLIGSELESMNKPIYDTKWASIVKAIKELYKGPLCYSVNWWFNEASLSNILTMQWFRLLDYIGVSAYFELTSKNDPTLEELIDAWSNPNRGVNPPTSILSDIDKLYRTFYKPIIFTEKGYRSVNGTNKQPWNSSSITHSDNRFDPEEQANCYEALFRVFHKLDWWRGCFIWPYDSSLDIKGEDKNYTPLKKPAEDVLRNWYKKQT